MRADQAMQSAELMAATYRAEMRRLLEAVDRIPAELRAAPIYGDWTVCEVLVHLAVWDRALAASADDVLAQRPARLARMRLDDVNVDEVDSRRGRPLDMARQELADSYQGLLDRLAGYSPEQWGAAPPGGVWSDGSPMTLASVFAYRYRDLTHYGGHAKEIEAWLDAG
jgi:uncharacterized protein (TIGR03083 family)